MNTHHRVLSPKTLQRIEDVSALGFMSRPDLAREYGLTPAALSSQLCQARKRKLIHVKIKRSKVYDWGNSKKSEPEHGPLGRSWEVSPGLRKEKRAAAIQARQSAADRAASECDTAKGNAGHS